MMTSLISVRKLCFSSNRNILSCTKHLKASVVSYFKFVSFTKLKKYSKVILYACHLYRIMLKNKENLRNISTLFIFKLRIEFFLWQPIFETIQIASITQGHTFRLLLKFSYVIDYLGCINIMFYLLL